MAVLRLPAHASRQGGYGSTINKGNHLAQGLVTALVPSPGLLMFDVVRRAHSNDPYLDGTLGTDSSAAAFPTRGFTGKGEMYAKGSSVNSTNLRNTYTHFPGDVGTSGSLSRATDRWTVSLIITPRLPVTSSSQDIAMAGGGSGWWWARFRMGTGTEQKFRAFGGHLDTHNPCVADTDYVVGQRYVLTLTSNLTGTGAANLFIDGIKQASNGTGYTGSATKPYQVLDLRPAPGTGLQGAWDFHGMYVWNRILTDAEISEFAYSPHQVFDNVSQSRIWVPYEEPAIGYVHRTFPRTSQPQLPATSNLNQGDPLTRGLVLAEGGFTPHTSKIATRGGWGLTSKKVLAKPVRAGVANSTVFVMQYFPATPEWNDSSSYPYRDTDQVWPGDLGLTVGANLSYGQLNLAARNTAGDVKTATFDLVSGTIPAGSLLMMTGTIDANLLATAYDHNGNLVGTSTALQGFTYNAPAATAAGAFVAGYQALSNGTALLLVLRWSRVLSDAEIKALHANPWRVFTQNTLGFLAPSSVEAGGNNTGTLTATLAEVTADITGAETFSGTMASALADSTMSATGTVTAPAARHLYLDPGADGQVSVYHSTALSGTDVTISGKYTVVARENATPQDWHTAQVAWHFGLNDPWPHYLIVFSSGYVQLFKNGSVVDDNWEVSLPYGTEHTFSISQSSNVITLTVNGTQVLNYTDPGTALSGGYVRLIAEQARVKFDDIGGTRSDDFNSHAEASYTVTQTFGNWVVWEDGGGTASIAPDSTAVTGTLSATLGTVTANISGAETFSGTLAATLAALIPSITGAETFSGTMAPTLDGITPSISGTVTTPSVTGTMAATLEGLASAFTGSEIFSGTLAATLASVTMSASGTTSQDNSVSGSMTGVLSATTMTASGEVKYSGALAATLGTVLSTIMGEEKFSGTLSRTLADSTMSMTGDQEMAGTMGASLGGVTPTITGSVGYSGTLSATLEDSIAEFIGTSSQPVTGTLIATLGSVTMAMYGENSAYEPVGAGTVDWRRRGRR